MKLSDERMAVRAIQILLLLTAWHRALLADEENPMVQVQQGKLRGVRQETVWGKEYLAFYGIPFAKPPVGSLRFKV
ncbi:hypothetical protein ANN_14679 [Periplaneta americana]|uniref:Carboxylesterase type B domain-containing protein n=1 Tax=Periplaneta americana TaxID=6978 RepID=A0ABQ8SWZ2_PERAM|nr:hypothetical protein ANN_14679 [Periplaneta americana]